jgi:hypothetical protein
MDFLLPKLAYMVSWETPASCAIASMVAPEYPFSMNSLSAASVIFLRVAEAWF